jgi:hypothetical protein
MGKPRTHREAGQSLILFTFLISAMVMIAALSVDIGMAYREQANAQDAADAAALGAAGVLYSGGSNTQAIAKAREIATANGYTNGVDGATVEVHVPPTSGDFVGVNQYAEVVINSTTDAYFAQVADINFFALRGRAVAGGVHNSSAYGIIALNEHECKAVDLNGNIGIYIHAAGIFVNSDCPTDAFWANGTVTVDTAVNAVVGGWDYSGNVSINPTPVNASHITDPLAALPVPVPPTNVQPCPPKVYTGTLNLSPGRYDCLIDPSGNRSINFLAGNYYFSQGLVADGGGNIVFNAGEYTFGGAGLKVSGSGRIDARAAVLYVEAGETMLTGTGTTRLLAPTSGPYAGISIFQNRTLTSTMNINGTSLASGFGVIYAKAAEVSFVGTTNSSNMQVISDTFSMSGNANLTLDWNGGVIVQQSFLRLVE